MFEDCSTYKPLLNLGLSFQDLKSIAKWHFYKLFLTLLLCEHNQTKFFLNDNKSFWKCQSVFRKKIISQFLLATFHDQSKAKLSNAEVKNKFPMDVFWTSYVRSIYVLCLLSCSTFIRWLYVSKVSTQKKLEIV